MNFQGSIFLVGLLKEKMQFRKSSYIIAEIFGKSELLRYFLFLKVLEHYSKNKEKNSEAIKHSSNAKLPSAVVKD